MVAAEYLIKCFINHLRLILDNTTIYFLKDILARRKAYIHVDEVKTLHVPQYKNLSLEKIMAFVSNKPRVSQYLPDEVDLPKIPKQWVVNVCAAVMGDLFKVWVQEQVEERNALMAEKKEIMIAMDPQMAAKFSASTHVSLTKGVSANMLKVGACFVFVETNGY